MRLPRALLVPLCLKAESALVATAFCLLFNSEPAYQICTCIRNDMIDLAIVALSVCKMHCILFGVDGPVEVQVRCAEPNSQPVCR